MPGAGPDEGGREGGGVRPAPPPPLRSLPLADRSLAPSHRPPPGRRLKCAEQVPSVQQQLCARVQAESRSHSSPRGIQPSVARVIPWGGTPGRRQSPPGGPRPEEGRRAH